jgi:hypothetical protein
MANAFASEGTSAEKALQELVSFEPQVERDIAQDRSERADLQRIMRGNCHMMLSVSGIPSQSDMTSGLPNDLVADPL